MIDTEYFFCLIYFHLWFTKLLIDGWIANFTQTQWFSWLDCIHTILLWIRKFHLSFLNWRFTWALSIIKIGWSITSKHFVFAVSFEYPSWLDRSDNTTYIYLNRQSNSIQTCWANRKWNAVCALVHIHSTFISLK